MIISLSSVPHTKTVRHLGKGSHWSLATHYHQENRSSAVTRESCLLKYLSCDSKSCYHLRLFDFIYLTIVAGYIRSRFPSDIKSRPLSSLAIHKRAFFFTSLAVSTLALYNQFLRTSCMTLPPHIAFEKSVIKRPDSSALKFTGECATRLRSTVRTLFLRIYIH